MKKLSMRFVTLLTTLLPLMLVVVVLCGIFIQTAKTTTNNSISELAKSSTEKLNLEIGKMMSPFKDKTKTIATMSKAKNEYSVLQLLVESSYKENPLEGLSYYFATSAPLTSKEGFLAHSTGWIPPKDWSPVTRGWWKDAVKNPERITFTNPYIDDMTGNICLTLSYAALDNNRNLLGVAGVDLLAEDFAKLVNVFRVSENGKTFLLLEDGNYLSHTDKAKVLKENYFNDKENVLPNSIDASALCNETKVFIEDNYYYVFSPVTDSPWYLVTQGPISDFTKNLKNSLLMILITVSVVFVIILLLDIRFISVLNKTIGKLVNQCRLMANGDFTLHLKDSRLKELSEFYRGFMDLSSGVTNLVEKIKMKVIQQMIYLKV